jgi:hypothetical protein
MMGGLRTVFGGAAVVVAGIIGAIVVPANTSPDNRAIGLAAGNAPPGLSRGTYEVLLIVSWILILLGIVVVAIGLIAYAQDRAGARR